MVRVTVGASYAVRCAVWFLVSLIAVLAVSDQADARRHRRHGHKSYAHRASYNPPYAAIVVDGNSGVALHEANADSLRHPASLTKIMTLYLLFERLEAGKIKLDTEMDVSAHAASMAPSKLDLRPGQTIKVEDAIRALVTKSANDVAAVVAEALAEDEESFAELMTKKARALGMSRTTYVNASGLPADEQITTARDQALLGRAIQERFPRYYRYFATPSFSYRGESMRNHNHLLGNVEGVDGIKTGYTQDSGFNLVTSVRRGNRHIVAVVLGGRSAGARDARMRELISEKIVEASVRKAPSVEVAEAKTQERTTERSADKPAKAGFALASASTTTVTLPTQSAAPTIAMPAQPQAAARIETAPIAPPSAPARTADTIEPIRVKTIKVKGNFTKMAMAGSVAPQSLVNQADEAITPSAPTLAKLPDPPAKIEKIEPARPMRADNGRSANDLVPVVAQADTVQIARVDAAKPEPASTNSHAGAHTGWIVQVGAFPAISEAQQRLASAQSKAREILGRADAFTEPVIKGNQTLYRARFAGLDKDTAEAACRHLKRNEIACMTVRN